MDYSLAVLRNRGASVKLVKIDEVDEWIVGADGTPVYDEMWVRFTMNEVADVEEKFGGATGLQESLASKPATTVRAMLSLLFRIDSRIVGLRMDPSLFKDYAEAIALSYMIANGVDPQQAVDQLKGSQDAADLETTIPTTSTPLESPGINGPDIGLAPVEPLLSSGA